MPRLATAPTPRASSASWLRENEENVSRSRLRCKTLAEKRGDSRCPRQVSFAFSLSCFFVPRHGADSIMGIEGGELRAGVRFIRSSEKKSAAVMGLWLQITHTNVRCDLFVQRGVDFVEICLALASVFLASSTRFTVGHNQNPGNRRVSGPGRIVTYDKCVSQSLWSPTQG